MKKSDRGATWTATIASKILADAREIARASGVRVVIKPISQSVIDYARRREDSRVALTRQAKELFAKISREFGLDEARRIFSVVLRDNPRRKGKRQTEDARQIDFALWVHAIRTGSPRGTARKFASDLSTSVPTLETRIKRILAEARKRGREDI
jgi:hypothetical protein